jgi:predicted DsbA family dithiol-disulfide isomerase
MLGLPAKTRVDADMERARALGINGTPTVFINGRQLTFEMFGVESMRQIIDVELQKATNQTQSNQSTIPSAGSTDNSAENK